MIRAINITLSVLVAFSVGCAGLLLLILVGSMLLHAWSIAVPFLLNLTRQL